MIKVYQTIFDRRKGNCMQAAVASILELPLEDVPHFILQKGWYDTMDTFFDSHGYDMWGYVWNPNRVDTEIRHKKKEDFELVRQWRGVNGYFIAGVYSDYTTDSGKGPIMHAVVVDDNFNIVHHVDQDRDSSYRYPRTEELGYNGIAEIMLIKPKESAKK